MLTSLELGEMVTDRVRRAYGTMSTHTMATEPKSSPAGGLCEHSGFPQALHRKGWLFGRFVTLSIDSRVQLASNDLNPYRCRNPNPVSSGARCEEQEVHQIGFKQLRRRSPRRSAERRCAGVLQRRHQPLLSLTWVARMHPLPVRCRRHVASPASSP